MCAGCTKIPPARKGGWKITVLLPFCKVLEHKNFEVNFSPSDTSSKCTSSSAKTLLMDS